jgi:peptidoglycan hydrolase-like protein with peptidoglycan-binding domain
MHAHAQGVFMLVLLAIMLLIVGKAAGPVVGGFFDEGGAVYAEPADDEDTVKEPESEPLTGDEIATLQRNLTTLGFDPGPVDGISGAKTKEAIAAAISEYALPVSSSNRHLLEYSTSLVAALNAADAADSDEAPLVDDGEPSEETTDDGTSSDTSTGQ